MSFITHKNHLGQLKTYTITETISTLTKKITWTPNVKSTQISHLWGQKRVVYGQVMFVLQVKIVVWKCLSHMKMWNSHVKMYMWFHVQFCFCMCTPVIIESPTITNSLFFWVPSGLSVLPLSALAPYCHPIISPCLLWIVPTSQLWRAHQFIKGQCYSVPETASCELWSLAGNGARQTPPRNLFPEASSSSNPHTVLAVFFQPITLSFPKSRLSCRDGDTKTTTLKHTLLTI